MRKAKSVDEYISNKPKWSAALAKLREVFLEIGLDEGIKWGAPIYMHGQKNVVGLSGFKSFVSLWYFQGALLKDQKGLLVNAQEGVTKAQRQMRFSSIDEIDTRVVKAYTLEAIANQEAGKEIKADTQKPLVIPPELDQAFGNDPDLQAAFDVLTLSKRREYADYISLAKRQETRNSRLEKCIPMILDGVGLSDKYRC